MSTAPTLSSEGSTGEYRAPAGEVMQTREHTYEPAGGSQQLDPPDQALDPLDRDVMGLLAEHVPLSLLMDLALPAGPPSSDVLTAEGLPTDRWWERR